MRKLCPDHVITAIAVAALLSAFASCSSEQLSAPPQGADSATTGRNEGRGESTPPQTGAAAPPANRSSQPNAATEKPIEAAARTFPSLPHACTAPPEWAVSDSPFDLQQYFATPADDATPLYLEALFEFDPEAMASCLSPAGIESHGSIAKGRAAGASQLAAAFEQDRKKVDPAAIDKLLPEFDRGFQMLAKAQQHKACLFQPGIGFEADLSHAAAARVVSRAVLLRVVRDVARGNRDRSAADVETVLRLSRDIRTRGFAVTTLISISMDGLVYQQTIPAILASPELTAADCDRLLAALRQHEAGPNLAVTALQGEYLMLRSVLRPEATKLLRDLAARPGVNEMFGGNIDARYLTAMADYASRLTAADFQPQIAAINGLYRSVEMLSRAPRHQRTQELPTALEATMRSNSPEFSGRYPLIATFLANWSAMFQAIDRHEAMHRGTLCLIALRRWQLGHTDSPSDLAGMLKDAGIDSVPTDPYSEEPLKMAVVNGQPVIYSIGEDGVDDGGMVEWDFKVQPPKGDMLIRLPPLVHRDSPPTSSVRKWTDRSGKFSIDAELLDFKDGTVRLKKEDGHILVLPVEKLSEPDQEYLRGLKPGRP
jgi:hypothetical protein